MSDQKISDDPSAGTLTGAEIVPVVSGGANKRTTTQAIADLVGLERRHEWTGTYDYCGVAPLGAADASAVWTITRIAVASAGTVTVTTATSVAWTNRATATYI